MKFVHIADMHFDTSFSQIKDGNLGTLRRIDQRKVFKKIIDYIEENSVDCLFIAGDLYEHKFIRESTIEFINEQFKRIENTKIFITPGNHDPYIKNSFYNKYNWNDNVFIFKSNISKIELEDVDIYGYGFEDFYMKDPKIFNVSVENHEKANIFITHGSVDGGYDDDRSYNPMSSSGLKQLDFDYIALGHIHKCNLTVDNKKIIYPGSTISLGFDEPGEHGMIVGNITKNSLTVDFVPLDESEFITSNVDISELSTIDELVERISTIGIGTNNYYEIYLVGQRNFDIDLYNLKKMIVSNRIIKIKNKTKISLDLEKIANENTLSGLFVREILERMENASEHDRKVLEQALEIGIEILDK